MTVDPIGTLARGHVAIDRKRDLRVYIGYDDKGYAVELATVDMIAWLQCNREGRDCMDRAVWRDILRMLFPE